MSEPTRNGRDVAGPAAPGRETRHRLWPLTRGEEEKADKLGRTQALQSAEDPTVIAALAVDPEAPPTGRSLVVFVLVLVQQLFRMVRRLAESVTAIQEMLSRPARRTSGSMAAAVEPSAEPSPLETSVSGMEETLQVLKNALDRIERVQAQEQATPATSRRSAIEYIILALALGALAFTAVNVYFQLKPSPPASQPDLAAELHSLRDARATLEQTNAVSMNVLQTMLRCGHEECLTTRFEINDQGKQVLIRENCRWVVDPNCPPSTTAPTGAARP